MPNQKIRKDQYILLLGRENYVVRCRDRFDCEFGGVDLNKVVGKKFGIKLKLGKESFTVVKPTITDIMFKLAKRAPQVVLPKDASTILAVTGVDKNASVVDAGTGSGFLSMFLANYVGKVSTYERKKEFYKLSSKNIKNSGLGNITAHLGDISKGIKERDVDLITLDMEKPEKVIRIALRALKPGGWITIYCLHVEGMQAVCKELAKRHFSNPTILENIQRNWQIQVGERTWTRPKTAMLGHTGFLVFARKI